MNKKNKSFFIVIYFLVISRKGTKALSQDGYYFMFTQRHKGARPESINIVICDSFNSVFNNASLKLINKPNFMSLTFK